ncbi:uncharacterized protein LOC144168358 [Haemaphysalis longicornis]
MASATSTAAAAAAGVPGPAQRADFRRSDEELFSESCEMDVSPADPYPSQRVRTVSDCASTGTVIANTGTDGHVVDDIECPRAADEPEEDDDHAGWTRVSHQRRRKKTVSVPEASPQRASPHAGKPSASQRHATLTRAQIASKVNAGMAKSARMPNFASRDEFRVVVRPRGGLEIGKTPLTDLRRAIFAAAKADEEAVREDTMLPNIAQNILVISTPSWERMLRYEVVKRIAIGDKEYETYAYRAAPEDTSRGVIRGVGLEDSADDIYRHVVNRHNPTAGDAHRLGRSMAVVILFHGSKVPSYVWYGGVVTRCYLYRQHKEVCRICGQIGHRKDVCPTPGARVCFACGLKNPGDGHEGKCKPRCRLCGGPHPTGEGSCKNKFKVPYQVRKRQWERKLEEERAKAATPAPKIRLSRRDEFPEIAPQRGSSRGRSASRRKSSQRSASRGGARSTSRGRRATSRGPAWAAIAAGAAGGAAAAPSRRRSESRRRSASRPPPRRGNNATKQASASPETVELRKMVKELQATVHAQRVTIEQLTLKLEELWGARATTWSKPAPAETTTTAKPTECPAPPLKQVAQRRASPAREQEVEDECDEDIGDAGSSMSTAASSTISKPTSYVSLNNRYRKLESQMNRWGKDFDALERRLTNRMIQVMQQAIQQAILPVQQQLNQLAASVRGAAQEHGNPITVSPP